MNRRATTAWTIAGVATVALAAVATAPLLTPAAVAPHAHVAAATAPMTAPHPSPSPTSDPDRVIWLGNGVGVKASELPKGCATYSKIEIFDVNAHSFGRLIGEAEDRGSSPGAMGTVNRDSAGAIVTYTAAPGDDIWSIGDRLCTNPLMVGRYNHIGSDRGDHVLQPGETVVIRPDMNVEWVPVS